GELALLLDRLRDLQRVVACELRLLLLEPLLLLRDFEPPLTGQCGKVALEIPNRIALDAAAGHTASGHMPGDVPGRLVTAKRDVLLDRLTGLRHDLVGRQPAGLIALQAENQVQKLLHRRSGRPARRSWGAGLPRTWLLWSAGPLRSGLPWPCWCLWTG